MKIGLSVPVMHEPSSLVALGVAAEECGIAEMAARDDAPADIVVAAPVGTDTAVYEGTSATWVLITGWLDALRKRASAPPR